MKTQLGSFFRNRILSRGIWILVVFICLPGSIYGQTKNQPVIEDATHRHTIQAVIDEINEIRKQLGGGIEEQLQGLHFGNPLKDQLKNDFDQEIERRLADSQAAILESGADHANSQRKNPVESGSQHRQTVAPFGHPGVLRPNPIQVVPKTATNQQMGNQPEELSLNRVFSFDQPVENESAALPTYSVLLARRTSAEHPPASPVRPLRSAARRMDEIAAELEEVGLFAEADSAREQALKFWLKARLLENQGQSGKHPRNR